MTISINSLKAIGATLALGLLGVACAAPTSGEGSDGTGDTPGVSPEVKAEASQAGTSAQPRWLGGEDQFEVVESASDGVCGQRCSVTCGNGSCSANAPAGGRVCCECSATGTPWCG